MSHDSDYSGLDQPQVLGIIFYPRSVWTKIPPGARDYLIPVDTGVSVSSRFFPAGKDAPCVLLFHGNGEVACDYDWLAPVYNQESISLFVADYRGYGRSGGAPSFSRMVRDAHPIFQFFLETMRLQENTGPFFIMGRSLGTASALELAFHYPDHFAGLIVESGAPNMVRLLAHHGFPVDRKKMGTLEASFDDGVKSITPPALIIHGAADMLIPPAEARRLYQHIGSCDKRLVIIPGVGHNDIMVSAVTEYIRAIREFVFSKKAAG